MIYYYLFILFVTPLILFRGKIFLTIVIIGCSLFLYFLQSNGFDYDGYKAALENAYYSATFPWFKTPSGLTAEPGYLFYSSLIGVLLPYGYEVFLVVNFIICFAISVILFARFKKNILPFFWLAMLPVIFPTLFYASPRSSISFFMVLSGFIFLVNSRLLFAMFFFFIGIMIHSQYIPISIIIIISAIALPIFIKASLIIKKITLSAVILLFLLAIINLHSLLGLIEMTFSYLPSSNVAIAKLHYLDSSNVGNFRLTSVLSIIIFPLLVASILKKTKKGTNIFFDDRKRNNRFVYLLLIIVIFSMIINIMFFNSPHLSGRISRFSDYVSLGIILPAFLLQTFGKVVSVVILFTLAAISPLLYSTVYNF